jgi:hypothetical protein
MMALGANGQIDDGLQHFCNILLRAFIAHIQFAPGLVKVVFIPNHEIGFCFNAFLLKTLDNQGIESPFYIGSPLCPALLFKMRVVEVFAVALRSP